MHREGILLAGLLCLCHTTLAPGAQTAYTEREIAPDAFQVKETINVMAISPDGKIVATGCPAGKPNVALWEVETGKRKHFLPASHHVNGVGFSADGKRVYAMSMGGTEHLEIWEVESGKKASNLRLFGRGEYTQTYRHDFSPCGKYFLTLEKDSGASKFRFSGGKMVPVSNPVLGIWDLAAGTRLKKFDGFLGQVGRFFPDGKEFVVGSEDGKLVIGTVESGKIEQTLVNGNGAVCDIKFSVADGSFVVADSKGSVSIWSFGKSFEKKSSFEIPGVTAPEKAGFPIEISADCSRVAANIGNAFTCFDIKSGKQVSKFGAGGNTPLAVSADGKVLAHMTPDGVALWNIDSKTILAQFVPAEDKKLPEGHKYRSAISEIDAEAKEKPSPVRVVLPCLDEQSFVVLRENGRAFLFSPKR